MLLRRCRWFRAVVLLTAVALCGSCYTTRLPPVSDSGATFEPLRDERRLWERARAEEDQLREKAPIYEDPLLVDYLEDVVAGLNPPGMSANDEIGYRVTVIEDPTLNAFAYPHGSIYVHTGLLARMDNEDELATVLGHEMTHVENRHMVRYQRSARNKQIGFGVAAVAAAVIVAGRQGDAVREGKYGKAARIGVFSDLLIGLGLQLALLASVNGYGRDLEREADEGGFDKLRRVGYDVDQAPEVYRKLLADHGDSSAAEVFFFGSHPRLGERVEDAERWIAEHPAEPGGGGGPALHDPERFRRRIRPVIRDDARLNIEKGRLKLAEDQLDRVLKLMPDDPETHYLLATLRLEQAARDDDPARQAELRAGAADALRESIRLDPERPSPHRELGLLAYRVEDFPTACVQFRQYVELDRQAADAGRIRDYVLELEREGHCP